MIGTIAKSAKSNSKSQLRKRNSRLSCCLIGSDFTDFNGSEIIDLNRRTDSLRLSVRLFKSINNIVSLPLKSVKSLNCHQGGHPLFSDN